RVAEALKLKAQAGRDERADACAGEMVLGQCTHERIDRVDVGVEGGEGGAERAVGGDGGVGGNLGKSVGRSKRVVVGQAVVAGALDVEGVQESDAHVGHE